LYTAPFRLKFDVASHNIVLSMRVISHSISALVHTLIKNSTSEVEFFIEVCTSIGEHVTVNPLTSIGEHVTDNPLSS
jgi:hypothetical protein